MNKKSGLIFLILFFSLFTVIILAEDSPENISIVSENPLTVSVLAQPNSGEVPLNVQFLASAAGAEPISYSWDFQCDGVSDSNTQNPSFVFNSPGEQEVCLTVIDANENIVTKELFITTTKHVSALNLTSYFPQDYELGENQMTLIIINNGKEPIENINAKIVGTGIQHLSSTIIPLLNPGDQDSLDIKMNIFQTGMLNPTIKITDKNFVLNLTVNKPLEINAEELQIKLSQLKEQLNEQERIYYEKKAQGFLVSEVYDSIKSIQKQVQDIQLQIITEKLKDAKLNLDLTGSAILDLSNNLENIQKPKVTLMIWLRDNALAITAIVAAFGTLSGILLKLKNQAQKAAVKVTEEVKNKLPLMKKKEENNLLKTEKTEDQKTENLGNLADKKAEEPKNSL